MFLTSRFGNEQVFIFPFSPSSWCIIYTDRGVFNDNKSLSFVSSLLPLTTRLSVCDCGSISGTCNVILTFHSDTEQVFSLPPRFLFCVFTHCLSTHFSRTTTTRHRQRVSDSCSLAFLSFTVLLRVFAPSTRQNVFTAFFKVFIYGLSSNVPSSGANVHPGWVSLGQSIGFPSITSLIPGSSAGSSSGCRYAFVSALDGAFVFHCTSAASSSFIFC